MNNNDTPAIYQNLTVFAVLPPILLGFIFVVWVLLSWIFRRKTKDLTGKIVSSFIVAFYLVHPSITKGVFSIFNCVEVEGMKWV